MYQDSGVQFLACHLFNSVPAINIARIKFYILVPLLHFLNFSSSIATWKIVKMIINLPAVYWAHRSNAYPFTTHKSSNNPEKQKTSLKSLTIGVDQEEKKY